MYDTILVPTDGSDQSVEAADHALEIARQFGSAIHAVHVIDDRGSGRMSEAVSELSRNSAERQEMEKRREATGNELIDGIVQRAHEAGIEAEGVVLSGDPADVITDYATEEGMGLIVLGARGRRRSASSSSGTSPGRSRDTPRRR